MKIKTSFLFGIIMLLLNPIIEAQEIIEASKNGNLEKIKEIIQNEPKFVNSKDKRNCTALHYASNNGNVEIVNYLLSKGADLSVKDIDGDTPLHWASYAGKNSVVEIIITEGVNLNPQNNGKETPLHTAVRRGNVEIVKLLCESGANTNAVNNYLRSAIHIVRPENCSAEICKILIQYGSDINLKNIYDETPLLYAVSMADKEMIKILLENDVEIPTNSTQANLLLHDAAVKSLSELVGRMIIGGSELSSNNNNGGTFLHSISAGGLTDFVEMAINKGNDINGINRYGYTPLQIAVINGQADIIDKLISFGVDINYRTILGETAFNLAEKLKYDSIIELLSSIGADSSIVQFPKMNGKYLGQKPPGIKPELFAPGIISTASLEHNGFVISPDGNEIYWASYQTKPPWQPQLLFTKFENDYWTIPDIAPFVGEWDAREPSSFSADGNRLYFTSEERPIKKDGRRVSGVWFVEREGKGWSEPEFLWNYIDLGGENGGSVKESKDGTLYFGAERSDSKGMTDIYRIKFVNDKYEKPENIGFPVNSEYSESAPDFSPDESYFIFGGDVRGDGMGGADLSICFRKQDGTWTKAVNMGPKVNSESHDACPFISPDGKYIFFESHRNGNADIYWVDSKIIEELKPKDLIGSVASDYK